MRHLLWLAVLAAPAAAQEAKQTPEGAQRFLSLLGEQESIKLMYIDTKVNSMTTFTVTSISSDAVCRTLLNGTARVVKKSPDWVEKPVVDGEPIVIDWSRTQGVWATSDYATIKPNDVSLGLPNATLVLTAIDTTLVKRLHYAMKFLKEHCDKTAETGF